jgi:protoporphyrin/coproporphyrin ferrochelatase
VSTPGVLLVNLGSPDSPKVGDVRRYLREFLMDERVLDAPYPVRFGVVHFAILPFRPRQSAEAYHKIWTPEGSPLVATSRRVRAALQQRLDIPVELAMRYQNPSIETALSALADRGVDELLLIPLFPHYAMSSYETAVERVKAVLPRYAPWMKLRVVPPCFEHPDYIEALTASAAEYLQHRYDHLLFSFHGIPERHLHKTDPTCGHCLKKENCCEVPGPAHATCYRAQCFRTAEAFTRKAGVRHYSIAFQSRLGRDPWLTPYTDTKLVRLAQDGVQRLLVICPAFVSDCLETIEEIGMRGRETFVAAGGKQFTLIPCLNDHPRWIAALETFVAEGLNSAERTAPQAGRTEVEKTRRDFDSARPAVSSVCL